MLSRIIILVAMLALVSCASHEPKPPQTQEIFSTLIKRDGVKEFSYTLALEKPSDARVPEAGHGHKHGSHGNAHGGHGEVDDRLDAMFENSLNMKINQTRYCRQGFKQYDRKNSHTAIQISGECNELANDDDRNKFPNPPPKKVIIETIQ